MHTDPLRRGPLVDRALAQRDDQVPTRETNRHAVERYRIASVSLVAASILVATVLAFVTSVRVDPKGTGPDAIAIAALLISARLWGWGRRFPRITDSFGTTALLCLAGTSCGAIAMLGLRLRMPMADSLLMAADQALRFDAFAMVRWLIEQGQWLFDAMAIAYNSTIPTLGISMVVLALIGNRLEAWRAAFNFIGCLFSICVIAIMTPAKGLGLWVPAELTAHLPHSWMRYFWLNFDNFYSGADPVLRLDTIDGVISFPSFHAAMAFITLAMWRKYPLVLVPAAAWVVLVLLATVACGGHYFVDLIGGFAVWAGWFAISQRMERATAAFDSATYAWDATGT